MNKIANQRYVICPDNLKIWEIKSINFWWKKMILWKDKNWEYILQSKYCTHLWVDLWKWKIIDDKIECPFHSYKFDKNWKPNVCIPKIKNFIVKKYLWMVWFFNWEKNDYELEDFFIKNNINLDLSNYFLINTFDEKYELPTKLIASNFYDLGHFTKVHWVKINNFKILDENEFLTQEFYWKYFPEYKFQKILFKIIPNKIYSKVIYKKNFMFSIHKILSNKWKTIFEYYWIFPTTPINEKETLIVSNILVKKWFFWILAKLFWRNILYKATSEEFEMLLWINYNINNFTKDDELLKNFLAFYDKEYAII